MNTRQKLDDDEAASEFINENLHLPEIREMALDRAISAGDHARAEQLCLGGLTEQDPRYRYREPKWRHRLFSVHEMTGNIPKMTQTARELLLDGDLDYFDIYKGLLEKQDAWNREAYAELLDAARTSMYDSSYMRLLSQEKEYALLMEQLQLHEYGIYEYAQELVGQYRSEVADVFTRQITKEAERVNKRSAYRHVCESIQKFAKAGCPEEAKGLIDELLLEYAIRPAFVDELRQARQRLK